MLTDREQLNIATHPKHGVERKQRSILPKHGVEIMKRWLYEHRYNAYPTVAEKITLSQEANITESQVSNWFINARRRILPKMIRREGRDPMHYVISQRGKKLSHGPMMIQDQQEFLEVENMTGGKRMRFDHDFEEVMTLMYRTEEESPGDYERSSPSKEETFNPWSMDVQYGLPVGNPGPSAKEIVPLRPLVPHPAARGSNGDPIVNPHLPQLPHLMVLPKVEVLSSYSVLPPEQPATQEEKDKFNCINEFNETAAAIFHLQKDQMEFQVTPSSD